VRGAPAATRDAQPPNLLHAVGVTTTRHLPNHARPAAGEILVEVPARLMISAPLAYTDPEIGHIFQHGGKLFDADSDVVSGAGMHVGSRHGDLEARAFSGERTW